MYLRKKENTKQDLDRNPGTGSPGGWEGMCYPQLEAGIYKRQER